MDAVDNKMSYFESWITEKATAILNKNLQYHLVLIISIAA
jgi:hypothetical protein